MLNIVMAVLPTHVEAKGDFFIPFCDWVNGFVILFGMIVSIGEYNGIANFKPILSCYIIL